MTHERLCAVLELYAAELTDRTHSVPRRFQDRRGLAGYSRLAAQFDHCLWMVAEMHRGMNPMCVAESRGGVMSLMPIEPSWPWPEDKLQRWLGFIQGVLWMGGIYTIEELRTHTRVIGGAPEMEP